MTELAEIPRDTFDGKDIFEQIGVQRIVFRASEFSPHLRQRDVTKSDYVFWDKARRGQSRGLELSGLFIKTLGSKIAGWSLGQRPNIRVESEAINTQINDWWDEWHPSILRAYNESLDLGDCYLVLNGDLSVTVVPPNMVTKIVDPKNFGRFLGYKIVAYIPHPEDIARKQRIEDWYMATQRVHIIKDESDNVISTHVFPNIVGKIPVIHIANRRGVDEENGRPEAESLLNALYRYGDVFDAALEGNIRQGRPTPVIKKMGSMTQVAAFWDRFGTRETRTLPDGSTETTLVIRFDPDVLMTLGGEAEFSYEAPNSFTQDTQNLLELIFYLILQHTEIPEFVWGNAIGGSKASAESQLEPFLKFIIKRRGEAMSWIRDLTEMVLTYISVYERQARGVKPVISWRPIASADGRLTLDTVIWAYNKGLFSKEVALWLLPLGIDNPKIILEDAPEVSPEEKLRMMGSGNRAPGGDSVSSGGTPQNNRKQEDPVQPTERSG